MKAPHFRTSWAFLVLAISVLPAITSGLRARTANEPRAQAFAVDLGEQWVGSMTSLELMNRKAPFKLNPGFFVATILHKVFRAFQATLEPARFRRTLALYVLESSYPAKDRDQVLDGVRAFLDQRKARRR